LTTTHFSLSIIEQFGEDEMWKFLGGILVGFLSVAASLSTIYGTWLTSVQRDVTYQVAIALASPGSDLTDLASAKSVPEAITALKEVVRPVQSPTIPEPEPITSVISVSGPEIIMDINKVYKVTDAQIPVVIRFLSLTSSQIDIYGERSYLDLSDSARLPKPVENCWLTFLAATLPPGEEKSETKGSAVFGVDCPNL
jgi:hypothetical protein